MNDGKMDGEVKGMALIIAIIVGGIVALFYNAGQVGKVRTLANERLQLACIEAKGKWVDDNCEFPE